MAVRVRVRMPVPMTVPIYRRCVHTVPHDPVGYWVMGVVVVEVIVVEVLHFCSVIEGACGEDGGDVVCRTLKYFNVSFTHVLLVQAAGCILGVVRGK